MHISKKFGLLVAAAVLSVTLGALLAPPTLQFHAQVGDTRVQRVYGGPVELLVGDELYSPYDSPDTVSVSIVLAEMTFDELAKVEHMPLQLGLWIDLPTVEVSHFGGWLFRGAAFKVWLRPFAWTG